MSQFSTRAPWLILGTALLGAMFISLISASPTPAQVGAAPTATYVTSGNTPVPTNTPRPSGNAPTATTAPAQAATPFPTASGLTGLPGLNFAMFPDLASLPGDVARMGTAIAAGGAANALTNPGSFSSQIGGATPTPVAQTATVGVGSTQTTVLTAQTAVTAIVSVTATPTATATSLGTPPPTETPMVVPVATAEALPTQPMISIDTPEHGGTLANGRPTLVGGWVVDPRVEGAGVVAVDVFLDGTPGNGTFIGAAEQSLMREDVAGFFGRPDWERSGFQFEWTPRGLAPGQHTLVVLVQLSAGGSVVTETPFSVR